MSDNPQPIKKLTRRQQVFIEKYLVCWNASEAARQAGYSEGVANRIGSLLLTNVDIKARIEARVSELAMSADEVLIGLSEQARGDIGQFFKIVEEWTFYPLPSYDIIDQKEVDVLGDDGEPTGEKKISYWVRHVSIDLYKLLDPKYSRLVQEFSDSPKDGLSVKLYSRQNALQFMAKIRNMIVDRSENKTDAKVIIEYANNPYPTPDVSSGAGGDTPEPKKV
jgi:Terminase small subunit